MVDAIVPAGLPAGVTSRPATEADIDVIVALMHAVEVDELGGPLTTRVELLADWARPSVDMATDTVLLLEDGRPVGYGEQFRGRSFNCVHPDAVGRGLGAALADWSEAHARASGLPDIGQTVPATATRAVAFLQARGYEMRWESWILKRDLHDEPAPPRAPDGLDIRSLRRPDDDRGLYEVINAAFSDWHDPISAMDFDDWRVSHLEREDADPDVMFVVADGDRLVGAAVCGIEDDEGWIYQLGVLREYRGRGLGGALLQQAFHGFHQRGVPVAALSTDSRTGAKSLYERVGMTVTDTFVRLALPLETLVVDEPAPAG